MTLMFKCVSLRLIKFPNLKNLDFLCFYRAFSFCFVFKIKLGFFLIIEDNTKGKKFSLDEKIQFSKISI